MKLATINVNGVRAAVNKNRGQSSGLGEWLRERDCDIVTLQEVRAPDAIARELLEPYGYHVVHAEAAARGRAGVAVLSRTAPSASRTLADWAESGRWIEAEVDGVTVISCYAPTGEAGTPRQEEKYRFFDAATKRLTELADGAAVLTGDLNIAHTERDIRNWRGNLKKAGFLPDERAYLTNWADSGWVDVHRAVAGDIDGPYTWWSMRGQAFDTDTGWRIDYQLATPALAATAQSAEVDRADSWAERWSDHAPLVIEYQI